METRQNHAEIKRRQLSDSICYLTKPYIQITTRSIGSDATLHGPFGPRKLLYADSTASGRCLSFVEEFLNTRVMPLYGNTHSTSSACGLQTSQFVEEARQTVKDAVGGGIRGMF